MKAYEVKFVGPAVVDRQLEAKVEKKKGLILPGDLRWNLDNRHTLILKGDLSETAIEFFKSGSHADEFKIKEIDVPDDFFEDDDVQADPEALEAAQAAKAEEKQADSGENLETTATPSNPVDSPAPRPGKATRR